ncbi:MAG TPA: diguanylate cyclase [Fimbriimonadaceae bacterium]|nr:diguanylate cyclase [Fimbriimonadaceae bacterium]
MVVGGLATIATTPLISISLSVSGAMLVCIENMLQKSRVEYRRLKDLETIIATTGLILTTTDPNGLVTGFNRTAEETLGYEAGDVIGKLTVRDLLKTDPEEGAVSSHAYAQLSDEPEQQEREFRRKDGSTFPALVTVRPIYGEDGKVAEYFGVGIDVSARKAGQEALREKQELIESIALTSPTIFYIFDLSCRRIVYSNRELPTMLGYTEEQVATMGSDPLPAVMHPEDLDILFNRYESCANLRDGEILESEFRCLSAFGELRWLSARDVVFKRDAEGNVTQILVNVVDTTDRRVLHEQIETQVLEIQDTNLALEIQTNALEEANAQLESLAFTDGLTGIANHRSFQEELAKSFDSAKRRKRRLSLMLVDVDQFKQYNDTYGHPSGDIVLKRVASVIRDSCPEGCLPARYGGEEFAVLCPGFSGNEVLMLAESIRNAIETTPWPERSVTVSIGAVSLSQDLATPSDLVSASDNALYSSKASGRNCVTFYDFEQRRRLAS